jgi:PqqD family protein of HPr-rel-A system
MRYERASGVESAPMQDETVLFAPASKKFYILNATAAHLWVMLERPRTEAELAQGLVDEFAGIDQDGATRDVQKTLRDLLDLGIVATAAG